MRQMLIWDFDWSMVDTDSDDWVIENLGATQILDEILNRQEELGWNKSMDLTLKTAHERFKYTKQQVQEACWSVPIHPSIVKVIKDIVEDSGTVQYIVSDANTIFIENILHYHDLQDAFRGIYTNKAWFDEDGAMRVGTFCEQSHTCPLCPPNLCKGEVCFVTYYIGSSIRGSIQVLETLLKEQSFDRVIYVGDGYGDFCPCSKLDSRGIILSRSHYPNTTEKCPLLQKLEDSGIGRYQNGVIVDHEKDLESNKRHPLVLPWKDQGSLSELLYSLGRRS